MTTRIHAEHDFPCTVDAYWDMFWDPEYNRTLAEGLGLAEHRELARTETGAAIETSLRVVPARDLPEVLRRAVPGLTTAYVEHRRFDRAARSIAWRVESDFRPSAVHCSGTVAVVPTAAGCRRVLDGTIEVSMFGVGGLVERAVAQDVSRSYAAAAEVGRAWLASRGMGTP